jgi:hypothetical protein
VSKKLLLNLVTVVGVFGGAWAVMYYVDHRPTYDITVDFPSINQRLYFYVRYTGITGDHRACVLSAKRRMLFSFDESEDFRYVGLNPQFVRSSADTLYIYTGEHAVAPKAFPGSIQIVQIAPPPSEMFDILKSYQSRGLMKIP